MERNSKSEISIEAARARERDSLWKLLGIVEDFSTEIKVNRYRVMRLRVAQILLTLILLTFIALWPQYREMLPERLNIIFTVNILTSLTVLLSWAEYNIRIHLSDSKRVKEVFRETSFLMHEIVDNMLRMEQLSPVERLELRIRLARLGTGDWKLDLRNRSLTS